MVSRRLLKYFPDYCRTLLSTFEKTKNAARIAPCRIRLLFAHYMYIKYIDKFRI